MNTRWYLTIIETRSTATPRGMGTANTWIPLRLYCTSTDISSTPVPKKDIVKDAVSHQNKSTNVA